MRNLIVLLAFFSLMATSSLAEDNLASARSVIERQIVAFLNDDVDSAYSFATPGVQKLFPEPQRFVDMVKRNYAPVYRPGNYAFGRALSETDGAVIAQELLITGPKRNNWRAVYILLRQTDGAYRINAVRMTRLKGSAI